MHSNPCRKASIKSGSYRQACLRLVSLPLHRRGAQRYSRIPGMGRSVLILGFVTAHAVQWRENSPSPRTAKAQQSDWRRLNAGHDKRLAGRLQERLANQRKDRNHKLSRRLVAENQRLVLVERSPHGASPKRLGRALPVLGTLNFEPCSPTSAVQAVGSTSKSRPRFSTKTCSACGSLSGPTGYAGLSGKAMGVCRVWDGARPRRERGREHTLCRGRNDPRELPQGSVWNPLSPG